MLNEVKSALGGKTIYSAIAIMFLSVFSLYSQASMQWSCIYDNSGIHDILEKTVIDNQGTVFLTGYKYIDGGSGITDPYIAKISTTGALQYTRSFTHPYLNNPNSRGSIFRSATADNQGNVIVAGHLDSAFGYNKGFVIKYNSSGDTVWARYTGIGDTVGFCSWGDIKIDNSGNIYVTGQWFKNSPSRRGFVTAKYNSNGVMQWLRSYNPPVVYWVDPVKTFLEFDNAGNIICASSYQKLSASSTYNIIALKYSSSGAEMWVNNFNGIGDLNDVATGLALDASGNAYVAGNSQNINYNYEITCIKFNASSGSVEWVFRADGTLNNTGSDDAAGIAINSSNEIYISGTLVNSGTLNDGVIIKLNSSGVEQWRRLEASGNVEQFKDVKTDNSGIYVVHSVLNGSYIVKVRKYNQNGDTLWNASYHVTNRTENPKFINVGPSNNVYISGDENIGNNTGYVYLVRYTNAISGVTPISNTTPDKFSLSQNYPNPFNPVTNIEFKVAEFKPVKIAVYNILGEQVSELVNKEMQAGTYKINFDASQLPSGAYFYRLTAGDFSETKKMLLVK